MSLASRLAGHGGAAFAVLLAFFVPLVSFVVTTSSQEQP
jgi:hypothetical protein